MISWFIPPLAALSASIFTFLLVYQGPLYRFWRSYTKHIKKHFHFLFISRSAARDALLHMILCIALAILALTKQSIALAMLLPILALIPEYVRAKNETKKREAISEQLASWLVILANALKSAPNISDALATSRSLVDSPLKEEIELLVNEIQLGEHLDRAIKRSTTRLQSSLYSSVMTTLLVARKSGGNLPLILNQSSDTLREMERLTGVVRTKTAEGRSQTIALLLIPFAMIAGLSKVNPQLIPGLAKSTAGLIILGLAISLWIAAVFISKQIMKVDI